MQQAATEYTSEVELGKTYADSVTNFSGVATQICFDATGDTRVYLEPMTSKENEPSKGAWFSELRVL